MSGTGCIGSPPHSLLPSTPPRAELCPRGRSCPFSHSDPPDVEVAYWSLVRPLSPRFAKQRPACECGSLTLGALPAIPHPPSAPPRLRPPDAAAASSALSPKIEAQYEKELRVLCSVELQ